LGHVVEREAEKGIPHFQKTDRASPKSEAIARFAQSLGNGAL
jgi:hypothetical protein